MQNNNVDIDKNRVQR